MFSREQAITRLNKYGVPFSEEAWQSEAKRKDGEFGVFAIIIRVIAGLFILGMMVVAIAGLIALLGLDSRWEHVAGTIGVLTTGFAAWKFCTSYKMLEKQYSFKGLMYLSLLLVGKACLLAALFGWFDTGLFRSESGWIVALVFSLITLASLFFYRMYLEAFLAILVSLFLLDVTLGAEMLKVLLPQDNMRVLGSGDEAQIMRIRSAGVLVSTLSVSLLIGMTAVLIAIQNRRYLSSVYFYAVVLFLAYKFLPLDNQVYWSLGSTIDVKLGVDLGMVVVGFCAVSTLYAFLIGGWQKLKSLEHVIVICCIIILAVLGLYGVLFAVALMALGHVRHDRVLWVIGLIYLPIYLFLFYYSLDVTLLIKSYMLLGSGIAILAARFVLLRFFNPLNAEVENA